jgi:hypothetical protein
LGVPDAHYRGATSFGANNRHWTLADDDPGGGVVGENVSLHDFPLKIPP